MKLIKSWFGDMGLSIRSPFGACGLIFNSMFPSLELPRIWRLSHLEVLENFMTMSYLTFMRCLQLPVDSQLLLTTPRLCLTVLETIAQRG